MSVLFSRACEYSLRGLSEMARHPSQKQWTIQELAARTDTPAPFLAKTFQALVRGKLLNSSKGRGGGFSFARPPGEISIMQVVMILDGPTLVEACALGLPTCNDTNPCPFHSHWAGLRASIVDALSTQTLADFARTDGALTAATSPPAPHEA
jgi:Rrf2 family iron-sulfur cluster assembly transcriptional regulator